MEGTGSSSSTVVSTTRSTHSPRGQVAAHRKIGQDRARRILRAVGREPIPSKATTVEEYIGSLPEERRPVVKKLRSLLKRRVPKGYRESVMWGMITYSIPLERFPDTYNGQPLCYLALGSQKNHLSLYLMCAYGDAKLRKKLEDGFLKAGKKLNMGKACIRFRSLDDLPLDVIGDIAGAVPVEGYLDIYRKSRKRAS